MTNKTTPVAYILTCPPGTYLPEPRIRTILERIENNRLAISAAGVPERTVLMLQKLAKETNRLDLFLAPELSSSTVFLEKALQEELAHHPTGLTIIINGGADLSENAFPSAIADIKNSPNCGLAVVSHTPGKNPSSSSFVLDMLQNPFYPLLTILRNELLKPHTSILRENLFFFALPELLLRLSLQTKFKILPSTYIQKFPASSKRTQKENEQRIMDEENSVLEKYQKKIFERKFTTLPVRELTDIYQHHITQTMELFKKLQNGILESVEDYDQHIFRYCLLAIFSGETENARQMMETSFSVVGERPALMRLYKQIVLNFSLQNQPISGPEKVSVVIPLFNQGHYLEEAVTSVVRQTWTNWEVIIINDGSTDNSYDTAKELLERLDDSRIKLITQENRGKGGTRNRGIKESSGEFVVTLDSDDMITPDYFAVGISLMKKNPRAAWITPKTLVFGKDNHVAWGDEYAPINTIIACPSPSSSLLRRCALEQLGLYREDLTNREDAEIWISLVENGWTSVTTDIPLFIYRHACRRPGLSDISNISSKEEITSLHPWWFRLDLNREIREKAFTSFPFYRFPDWFLNWDNINKIVPLFNNQEKFLAAMQKLKESYPPINKPCRWNSDNDDCYLDIREALYGVRSQK
ncbi:Glycosyl transferase family 2 [Maridesulfovibrio ferrireducens]|uniref:Glycosyl transferase family 2 n=1 Tax=Maridesulfovibrio ferrireducens TaxID=246191 RepID=A0A1G9ERR4_9BACT|nr:glycosyltransferase family A protein [Maridesulfovibrio ferrireducens]SDK78705.1 Glycosyl transferase family 2 [Maridesulfovibrio ferrireducens]